MVPRRPALLLLRRGLGGRALERRQPPGAVDQPDAERRDAEDLDCVFLFLVGRD